MDNPFTAIDKRLSNIEDLLLQIKHQPATPNTGTPDLMTIKQASDFLCLTVPTLYSKVSRGELPVMKRGKRLYFSQIELYDYLKRGRKKPVSELVDEDGGFVKF